MEIALTPAHEKVVGKLAANEPYNKKAILDRTAMISVKKEGGVIVTRDKGNIVSKFRPSKIYEIVDFNDAVKTLLSVIDGIFNPEFYNITVKAGYQELKLRGKSHKINGDVFHEMVWLTNSTDGTKRLSIRYGLMRQWCSNGAVMTYKGSSFRVKHLTTNNVNEELKAFMLQLPKLDVTKTIKRLKSIGGKTITVRELSDSLVNKIGKKGNDTIWKLLVDKMASSKTDRIGTKEDALITGIKVPFNEMTKETLDTPLDSWKVFNCYTELWRSLDAGEIERETNKILEILN
jgi:hypothetical protein